MINYTTGDIIKRAQELADLQNSDFISWAENMHLLDESFKKLYQECINANDKYWLKTITVNDLVKLDNKRNEVTFALPEDFYQLQSIVNKTNSIPILKRALTESIGESRYDMINNTIVFYGGAEQKNLEIKYYPIPKTLTIKAPEVNVTVEGNILDCNGAKYLVVDYGATTTTFTVGDVTTGAAKTFIYNEAVTIQSAVLGKKCFVLLLDDDTVLKCTMSGTFSVITDSLIMKADNKAFTYKLEEDDVMKVYNEAGTLCEQFVIALGEDIISPITMDSGAVYSITGNKLYSCAKGSTEKKELAEVTETKIQSINDSLFWVNSDIYCNGEVIVSYEDFDAVVGFNKVDYDTGYGISVTSLDDDYIHLKSCFTDTSLDFPNNFYFNYLAYQIAVAYKTKQNADATALIQLAGEESYQFFNSLSRDVAENFRIQNVYTNGGIY